MNRGNLNVNLSGKAIIPRNFKPRSCRSFHNIIKEVAELNNKQQKIGRNKNRSTTNRQVVDMALTLWECSDYIAKAMMRTNLNSYFRDRLARINQRLQKEAIDLGNDLVPANKNAFDASYSTQTIARQLGLLK